MGHRAINFPDVDRHPAHSIRSVAGFVLCALLAGCASTTVTLLPSQRTSVCNRAATTLVLWAPQWRADQKDVAEREQAAAAGLKSFLAGSDCFARAELRRVATTDPTAISMQLAASADAFTQVVVIGVRELGPVVKLLSGFALLEGGTEAVLEVSEYLPPQTTHPRHFTIQWRNGGPGVLKGVASLPNDMEAALRAGM